MRVAVVKSEAGVVSECAEWGRSTKACLQVSVLAALTLLLLLLCGCGGGSHVGKKTGKGSAVFTIQWPSLQKSTRLIPASSNVIRIQITAGMNGGGSVYGTQDTVRPASGPLTTTLTFNNLPPGNFYATAKAYRDYQPPSTTPNPAFDFSAVVPQAAASLPLTIADGQATPSNLTMASTIVGIRFFGLGPGNRLVVPKGQLQPLSFVTYNQSGAVVLTPPTQIQFRLSNPQIATFVSGPSFQNVLIGVQRGVEQITATEPESGVTTSFTVLVPGLALSAWPKFHQNEANQGRAASASVSGTVGAQKWVAATGGPVRSSPVIGVDGTIYVGSDDTYLYALDGATGQRKWRYQTDARISSSPAVSADGTVYVCSENGTMYALADNATSPSLKWSYALATPVFFSSPTIGADGTIYIGADNGTIYAVTDYGSSFGLKWSYSISAQFGFDSAVLHASPALGIDGTIYVLVLANLNGAYAEPFAITDAGSAATPKWRYATAASPAYSSPALGADGTVYTALGFSLYAFSDNPFTLKWNSFALSSIATSSPAVGATGAIYIGTDSGNVSSCDSNGNNRWSLALGGSVTSSPAVGADGTIYVGTKNAVSGNKLYAITDAGASGTQKWAFSLGDVESSPAIGADGTVYIGSDDGSVYAIK